MCPDFPIFTQFLKLDIALEPSPRCRPVLFQHLQYSFSPIIEKINILLKSEHASFFDLTFYFKYYKHKIITMHKSRVIMQLFLRSERHLHQCIKICTCLPCCTRLSLEFEHKFVQLFKMCEKCSNYSLVKCRELNIIEVTVIHTRHVSTKRNVTLEHFHRSISIFSHQRYFSMKHQNYFARESGARGFIISACSHLATKSSFKKSSGTES